MRVRVRFLLHKIFELEKDSYLVDNVSEDSTVTEFLKILSEELGSEVLLKLITGSGGKGLLILVNGAVINDLSRTFKSLKIPFRDSKEFEITIAPLLEGG
jgi:acetyl/propionyl-CoA carboxylase alpha subunit